MIQRQPALFIGHGSPLEAIEPSRYSAAWTQLGRTLPRPRAILAVSAHWYTQGTAVTVALRPRTIHDFYGFPAPMYQLRYPAHGDPGLAAQVQAFLAPSTVHADAEWGFDHGTWVVLQYMYPDADIPTIQLSIDARLPPAAHFELGRKLQTLRESGVLVLGSGNVVHNLRALQRSATAPEHDWAMTFNEAVRHAVLRGDHQALIDYHTLAGNAARMSVPTPEHYLPLLYVLGVVAGDERVSVPIDGIDMGALSMLSVQVGG
jgi:4,5-DOPA dioxygenase extradiol